MKDLKLLTNQVVVPEEDDEKYKKIVLIIVAVFFAVFILWGGFAKLSSAVPAIGTVETAFNDRVIQHLEGGIVDKIYVKDGDFVKEGQVLLKIDDKKSSADFRAVASKYYEQLSLNNRLAAERNGSKTIVFDKELTDDNDSFKQSFIDTQKFEFKIRQNELNSQLQILNERKTQLEGQLQGVTAEIDAKKELLSTYQKQIVELQKLYDEKLIDKLKLTEETRLKLNTEADIAIKTGEKARLSAQISEVKMQMQDIKQNFIKQVSAEFTNSQTQVADLRERFAMYKDTMHRTDIKAPVAGYVVNLSVNTIGSVVTPGKPLMSIVPKDESLIVECKVSPSDIHYVKQKLQVKLTFPSFAHIKSLKDVEGEVIDVAADATMDEQNRMEFYKARVKISTKGEEELAKNNLKIKPGMPVEAMIITGDRTFLQYMIQPIENMFRKGMREQ